LSASGRRATVLMPRSGSCAVSVDGAKPVVLDPRRFLFVPAGRAFRMAPATRLEATGRAIRLSNDVADGLRSPAGESKIRKEIPFVMEIGDLVAILAALNRWKPDENDPKARLDVAISVRSALLAASPSAAWVDSRSMRTARRARALLVDGFAHPLTLAAIGRSLGLSPYYICHVFRRHFGISIHQFVLDLRVRRALDLISRGGVNFGEIGDTLGFSSPSHFSSAIRARVGCTPSELARLLAPPDELR